MVWKLIPWREYPLSHLWQRREKAQLEQARFQFENEKETLRKLQQQAYYETINSNNKTAYAAKMVELQRSKLKVQEEKITIVRNRLEEGRALPQDL